MQMVKKHFKIQMNNTSELCCKNKHHIDEIVFVISLSSVNVRVFSYVQLISQHMAPGLQRKRQLAIQFQLDFNTSSGATSCPTSSWK